MLLKEDTITAVKDRMDIVDVVGHFIILKKNTACCPFHDEKTPSFHVHPRKNIYKCFGCGKGGDAINFVMEHEKKTYLEAIEFLAGMYNLTLEYDEHYDPAKDQEKKDHISELRSVVKFAHTKYVANLKKSVNALEYLHKRGFTKRMISEWELGFAPDDFRFITPSLVNSGKLSLATEAGICVTKDGKNYDFYRNRITIPIHNSKGELAGLAGRLMPGEQKSLAKYFNPMESEIYHKQKILFGLHQAITAKTFKNFDYVYIVEGYFDVIRMHEAGMYNTVATSGTEICDEQIKMLMRHVKHMVLLYDGDQAGQTKAMKHVDSFLRLGCKVEVAELPDGKDPADYINDLMPVRMGEMEEVA